MKFASKIALFLFTTVFAISASFAGPKDAIRNHGDAYPAQHGPFIYGQSTTLGETKLQTNKHIIPYLPRDIRSNLQLGFGCNEHGQYSATDHKNGCLDYVSSSTKTKWRVRFGQAGAAEKVFKLGANDAAVPYVEFAKGDIYTVIYEAPNAKQYAQGSGNVQPQSSSGVGTMSQPSAPAQATNDCDNLSWAQKITCNATKNSGAVGGTIDAGLKAFKK